MLCVLFELCWSLSVFRPRRGLTSHSTGDQAVPSCGQCTKSNKECPGYRNLLDLAFRDESSSVIRKAKAKARKASSPPALLPPPRDSKATPHVEQISTRIHAPETDLSDVSTDTSSSFAGAPIINCPEAHANSIISLTNSDKYEEAVQLALAPHFSLLPSAEEVGINCFFSNFVLEPSGPSHGHFSYIPELCRQSGLDGALTASMKAAGLAICANTTKSPEIMRQARQGYVTALRKINSALRSPKEAIRDTILLSIMVVSIFENLAGSNRLSLKAWTEHINGATALLILRGPSQLRTAAGYGLFINVSSQLLISCVLRDIPMPPQLMKLRLEAFSLLPSDPGLQFAKIMDEFTTFRAAITNRTLTDNEAIIAQASIFDSRIASIFAKPLSGWLYETVHTDADPEIIWNGAYDIYYDQWVAQMWNWMRACRIMINEIIRSRLLQGFESIPPRFTTPEYTSKFQHSTEVLINMRDDVLRSIPQHIGYVTRKPFTYPISPPYTSSPGTIFGDVFSDVSFNEFLNGIPSPQTPSSPPRMQPAPGIGGYHLLWPLHVCGVSQVSTPAVHKYVLRWMRYIGDTMGINSLANILAATQLMNEQRIQGQRQHQPLDPLAPGEHMYQ